MDSRMAPAIVLVGVSCITRMRHGDIARSPVLDYHGRPARQISRCVLLRKVARTVDVLPPFVGSEGESELQTKERVLRNHSRNHRMGESWMRECSHVPVGESVIDSRSFRM